MSGHNVRPCATNHPNPFETQSTCTVCWNAINVRKYQDLWRLPQTGAFERVPANRADLMKALNPGGTTRAAHVGSGPCIHLGGSVPPPNRQPTQRTYHECEHPKQPLGNPVCSCTGCGPKCVGYEAEKEVTSLSLPKRFSSFGPIGKRHLVYFVLPVSGNGVWQRGIDALRLRWSLFTGRKIIAVARGNEVDEQADPAEGDLHAVRKRKIDPIEAVRNYLPTDAEVIEVDNAPGEWEGVAWARLWQSVLTTAHDTDAILYAHAKGVTRRVGSPVHSWAELLYRLALDYWPQTEEALRQFPIVGSLLRSGSIFGTPLEASKWHYSGNFWWVRAEVIRAQLAAFPLPKDRWAAEAWPGIAFAESQAGELFQPPGDFYLYKAVDLDYVLGEFAKWAQTNTPTATVPATSPKEHPIRLSVIVTTKGRSTVGRTVETVLSQIVHGDELIVERDDSNDWGATPRTRGQRAAQGNYLLYMDDDDIYAPGAFAVIRQALGENPNRPHMFRIRRGEPFNDLLPRAHTLEVGNVSTQMFVTPNIPDRLGEWGTRYEGDYDFIVSTLAKWPGGSLVWHDRVIALWRPGPIHSPATLLPEIDGQSPPAWWSFDAGRLQDWHTWQEVVVNDTYGFRNLNLPGATVLDIGAHIGSAAYLAYNLGAKLIHCYEPEAETLDYLRQNLKHIPGAIAFPVSVGAHVGRGFRSGEVVYAPTISLDDALQWFTGRVDLIKIDIEGGEWETFSCAKDLSKVEKIVGEWHAKAIGGKTWKKEDLQPILGPHGFAVRFLSENGTTGVFLAERPQTQA